MPPLKSNKLIQVIFALVVGIVVIIFWRISRDGNAVSAGSAMSAVPSTAKPDADKNNWVGNANRDSKANADADTPNETLKTLTAQVNSMRGDMQRITDENNQLRDQVKNGTPYSNGPVTPSSKGKGEPEPLSATPPEAATTGPDAANPGNAQGGNRGLLGGKGITDFLPDFSGRNGKNGAGSLNPATLSPATGGDGTPPQAAAPQSRTVIPMGYSVGKGADGREGLVRTAPSGMPVAGQKPQSYAQAANESNTALAGGNAAIIDPATGQAQGGSGAPATGANGKKDKPFWTIPENATLIGATAMTAIVGRVPVDGHVQDPMQFKLLLGPTNLAANGHFLPPDLAGIVLSGIAIGDMTLSCSEGVIQSLTFVFNDGSIRTVSMGNAGGAGAGQQAGNGISNMAKLGFLSDRYGNPCITGKFVTNAPAFLTDVVGLKALSLAGKAASSSQTTTSSNALGTSSSTVSGAKGTYILGETVSGATDSVSDWLTRRMGSSFDAVVTPAGAEVVIHINREIAIDKAGNARKIDYGRLDSVASSRKGARHGLD
ncbi:TIGR03752 family integrating conjugative element protein [Uliginosibacterium gangwonense]|uniref:TIGR03752 family integrating conjugative element protein n=1 Tax=Uliginosibacterium gangwonense TaxID=392736 RepID=UPI00037A7D5D|nr:TIGR03752 family integrating conjugative element protein [Uliginosibacterium gangwonense]